jgi:hypothetical protein
MMLKLLETPNYWETRKGQITELLFFFSLPRPQAEIRRQLERLAKSPAFLYGMTHGKELSLAIDVAMAAHEISDLDRCDPDLARRDPEKHRLWHKTPVAEFVRGYWEAAKKPCAPLMAKATMLRLNQSKVNQEILAHAFGCDPRTLQKRFGEDAVREACELGIRHYDPPALTAPRPGQAKPKEKLNWRHDKGRLGRARNRLRLNRRSQHGQEAKDEF